ncbi:GntR family transcriptional regulator [Streptomyces sp. WAC 06783]|uniref:GntR family transcriptional regulator YhfZ n=1 Tax=Streptomyces sp. WAC 06783 TaxID=2203211 RepID=UPI000F74279A|nr:GntR family transcriptional regulator YhfZ [Streptomyces sp. WAC 06783]RSO04927.1 GntR family transcriptional regulator [Streptomyces sp. WAC 06783]
MNSIDERFLTRNGHAARRLAALLINQPTEGEGARLPRVRDLATELGVGNGTVQAALQLLEESGAMDTVARGHLGTFLVRADRAILWRIAGLGTVLAAMPLPHSRRREGLATGLRGAFEKTGAPFAITFMRGAATRVGALLDGKVDLAVLSRFAADALMEQHPIDLIADLGPATYAGAHGLLLRHGVQPDSEGLRVAVDNTSEDQRALAERAFAGRTDVTWLESSFTQLYDLFAQDRADATVWNLDEVPGQLAGEVDVLPLDIEITGDFSPRSSSAALIARKEGSEALTAVSGVLDLEAVTSLQTEVLRGERMPSY